MVLQCEVKLRRFDLGCVGVPRIDGSSGQLGQRMINLSMFLGEMSFRSSHAIIHEQEIGDWMKDLVNA